MLDVNHSIVNVGDEVFFLIQGSWSLVPGKITGFGKGTMNKDVAYILFQGATWTRWSEHISKSFGNKSQATNENFTNALEIQEKPCKTCSRKNFTNCTKCWWCDRINPTV